MSERIKCQKDKKIVYNYLRGFKKNNEDTEFDYDKSWPDNDGPLKNIKLSTIFALAFSMGYKNNLKETLSSQKDLSNPTNFEDFLMPMIKSVAIINSDEKEEILNKELRDIYKNAEEYANAGIDLLLNEYIEDMDAIINEWHLDIDEIINEKDIFNKIENL
ncbi:MAG: hypothetical protein IKH85_07000 [Methanobrevibacter sp.]|uniref:hypothetical protein n=1 Tax=Methanobrevibacter sp. TaxID=66852 RepID=UPI0025FE579D|nr:hypothetical protein [Methanobrevibacter sp.]MBR6993804.1 hypothetical protein [Methanobrevibacter sp.]